MEISENQIWINKKKGTKYIVLLANVKNATNANDGEVMVLYTEYEGKEGLYFNNIIWCREKKEFLEKFNYHGRIEDETN